MPIGSKAGEGRPDRQILRGMLQRGCTDLSRCATDPVNGYLPLRLPFYGSGGSHGFAVKPPGVIPNLRICSASATRPVLSKKAANSSIALDLSS